MVNCPEGSSHSIYNTGTEEPVLFTVVRHSVLLSFIWTFFT